jgi:hypothetical protein
MLLAMRFRALSATLRDMSATRRPFSRTPVIVSRIRSAGDKATRAQNVCLWSPADMLVGGVGVRFRQWSGRRAAVFYKRARSRFSDMRCDTKLRLLAVRLPTHRHEGIEGDQD